MGEGKTVAGQSAGVGGKVRVQQPTGGGGRSRRLGICHHSGSILPAPLRLLQDLAKVGGGHHLSPPSIVISSTAQSPALQRRNAIIRKNSAPARAKPWIEIAGQQAATAVNATGHYVNQLLDVTEAKLKQHQQRCSLTAVSQGLSIISTPAVVVLYVSDRRPSLLSRPASYRRDSQPRRPSAADCRPAAAVDIRPQIPSSHHRHRGGDGPSRHVSYPATRRGVRRSSSLWRGQRRRWSLGPATSWIQPSGVQITQKPTTKIICD